MSNSIYRNSEGYYDPTAGAALAKCDRKAKSDRRKATRKANARARKQAAESSMEILEITTECGEITAPAKGDEYESL